MKWLWVCGCVWWLFAHSTKCASPLVHCSFDLDSGEFVLLQPDGAKSGAGMFTAYAETIVTSAVKVQAVKAVTSGDQIRNSLKEGLSDPSKWLGEYELPKALGVDSVVWLDDSGSTIFARSKKDPKSWVEYHSGKKFAVFEELVFDKAPFWFVLLIDRGRGIWVTLEPGNARWARDSDRTEDLSQGIDERRLRHELMKGNFVP